MTLIEDLKSWAEKVSAAKHKLDQQMFNDIIKLLERRIPVEGIDAMMTWLEEQHIKGKNSMMRGPHLLSTNSKQIRDKLWSLQRAEAKSGI